MPSIASVPSVQSVTQERRAREVERKYQPDIPNRMLTSKNQGVNSMGLLAQAAVPALPTPAEVVGVGGEAERGSPEWPEQGWPKRRPGEFDWESVR